MAVRIQGGARRRWVRKPLPGSHTTHPSRRRTERRTTMRPRDAEDPWRRHAVAVAITPRYRPMCKVVVTTQQEGKASKIDITKLGLQERRALIERLVANVEEDNEKFLLKLRSRIDRVGVDTPTIEVRFKHLNVEANIHVGSRALPTLTNYMVNIVEGLLVIQLTAWIKKMHPPQCGRESMTCTGPITGQMTFLLAGFGLLIVGAAGIRPCWIFPMFCSN